MTPLPREGLTRVFFLRRSAFSLRSCLPGEKAQLLRLQALSPPRRDLSRSSRWRPHAETPGSLRRHSLRASNRGTASSHCSTFLFAHAIPRRKTCFVFDLPPSRRGAAGEKHLGECRTRTLKPSICEGQTRPLSSVSPSFFRVYSSRSPRSSSAFSASSASSAVSPCSLLSTRRRECLTPVPPRCRPFSTAEKLTVSSASSSSQKAENWISAFLSSADELAVSPRKTKKSNDPSSPSSSPASPRRGVLPLFRRVSRLPLDASLLRNLKSVGVSHLTQIQDACFLPILLGKDVVGAAKPGTGKTLAYLLPLLQRSLNASPATSEDLGNARDGEAGGASRCDAAREDARRDPPSRDASGGPSILILVPTRELCRQVAATVSALAPSLSVAVLDASWASVHAQERLLESFAHTQGRGRPLDVVVGAPERCEKLFLSGHLRLGGLKACVIDEADALLRRGYAERIETLFSLRSPISREGEKAGDAGDGRSKRTREGRDYPRHRVQTLVFTAAMPTELQAIVDSHFKQATVVNLLRKTTLRTPSELAASASPLFSSRVAGEPLETADAAASSTSLCSDTVRHLKCRIPRGPDSEVRMQALLYLLAKALPAATHPQRASEAAASESRREQEYLEKLGDNASGQESRRAGEEMPPQVAEGLLSAEEDTHQCIVFVDTQQEVEQLAQHPFLQSWRVAPLHAGLEHEQRDTNLSRFRSGEVPVLIATDVVARGLDIPAVTLVVHLHPPVNPSTYIHRSGRAGRGGRAGDSVVLYSSSERGKLAEIVQQTRTRFLNLPPPTQAQQQETAIARTLYELLEVKEEHFRPLLARAEALLQTHGPCVFAAALAFLQGKHRLPRLLGARAEISDSEELSSRSLLSGRKGFAAVLVYDPTHQELDSTAAAARYLRTRLPESARHDAVGLVCKSVKGYARTLGGGEAAGETQTPRSAALGENETPGFRRFGDCSGRTAKGGSPQDSCGHQATPARHRDTLTRKIMGFLCMPGAGERKGGERRGEKTQQQGPEGS
ncbi:UNVERIFIED_CONTAM: DEAD/DEAH box helicase domain-containing protein [Hammondia hammondi]|eukprot:XP_008881987.1 DEAD/DEAH box helicase domain-containing protein [Hammondia hammondi]